MTHGLERMVWASAENSTETMQHTSCLYGGSPANRKS